MLKKFAVFTGQLILIAFLAFVAREAWRGYVREKSFEAIARTGIPVSVRITHISREKHDWTDYLGYGKYIAFDYHGKTYELRYLPDSGWIGEGTRLVLLYSPSLDRFLQPSLIRHPEPNVRVSRLVEWSVVGSFRFANRWLLAFIILSVVTGLFVFSLLFNLTGWAVFDSLARLFKIAGALGLLGYFTWNTFSNYSFYNRVKTGTPQKTLILETAKNAVFINNRSDAFVLHYYTALVPDSMAGNKTRRIMISEEEYDRVRKGNELPVLYHSSLNEMMSATYRFELYKWVFLGLIWIIAIQMFVTGVKGKKPAA